MDECIYLDNAATTFPKPECVYRAMDEANRGFAVNAGRGAYALAKKAEDMLTNTKALLKQMAKAESVAEVVLTASATLACNQVLGGLSWEQTDVVYVSPYEHNAVMRVLYQLQKKYGFTVTELCIDTETLELDLERIQIQFAGKPPTHVVMTHVSNILGYILPVERIAKLAKTWNAQVIVDGAQALGTVPVDLRKLKADYYIFAGHKALYGPFGIGGFFIRDGNRLQPFLAGGTGSDSLNPAMPLGSVEGLEPGSHNIIAASGLFAAVMEVNKTAFLEKEQEMSEFLFRQLSQIYGVTVYRAGNLENQTGIVSFEVEGYLAGEVGLILDEDYHIAVRCGYQCAPLIHKYLHSERYAGVVRVSTGRYTKKEELELFIRAVSEIAEG